MNKLQVRDTSPRNITIMISQRSQTQKKCPTRFHLYKKFKTGKINL